MRNVWGLGFLLLAAPAAVGQDMPLTQVILPGKGWQALPIECSSAAGLAGDGRGDVFVADPDGRQIWRVGPDGKAARFAKTDGTVHGLAVAPDGRLFAGQPENERVLVYDAEGKEVARHTGLGAGDLAMTKAGDCYCSVPEEKAVFLLSADGQKRKVAEDFVLPGAVALWNDGGTLVVADAGDKCMYAFRVQKNGDLDAREPYYPFRVRPKQPCENAGLTLDAAGRAYATSREGLQVFDPTGRLSGVLVAPERAPLAGVAFGGADLDRLYVACGGKVYLRKTLAKGVKAVEAKGP